MGGGRTKTVAKQGESVIGRQLRGAMLTSLVRSGISTWPTLCGSIQVEADDDQYPERSIYGGTHDCAPEWVEPLELS